MDLLGRCPKCGNGPFEHEPLARPMPDLAPGLTNAPGTEPEERYCAHCGAPLWETCHICHGSGRSTLLLADPAVRAGEYCTHCGRLLRRRKTDTVCTSCGGSGKVRAPHHCRY
jgi:hypothetical protein